MKEIIGDLFQQDCDAICITTNNFVDRYGCNVMGAGVAGAAKHRWPMLPARLGNTIVERGPGLHLLTFRLGEEAALPSTPVGIYLGHVLVPYHIVAFPTKPERVTDPDDLIDRYRRQYQDYYEVDLPGWMGKSTTSLIACSASGLIKLTNEMDWEKVVLPKPGCSNGGLSWQKDVRPLLQEVLDDRFCVIDRR